MRVVSQERLGTILSALESRLFMHSAKFSHGVNVAAGGPRLHLAVMHECVVDIEPAFGGMITVLAEHEYVPQPEPAGPSE